MRAGKIIRPAKRERGASLTEFAIVAPLFIAMIYGSLYLTDVGTFKLKAQEIARYGAWAFTLRPLSDFEDENFRHTDKFNEARDSVADELYDVYYDLDGANDRFLPVPGAWSKTMAAVYEPPASADFRNRPAQMVPSWANASLAQPLSSLWWILQMTGIGADTNSILSGPFGDMHFNTKGQVTARAKVRLLPMIRPQQMRENIAMAKIGGERGADLSPWNPMTQPLRNSNGDPIKQTLIADAWKVQQGWSAHPKNIGDRSKTHYANMVEEVSDKAITALPGGSVLNVIFQLMGLFQAFPGGELAAMFAGIPPDAPSAHLFSRPYSDKQGRDMQRRPWQPNPLRTGQVDIFRETDTPNGKPQEKWAVRRFETGALYYDVNNPLSGGYHESLLERGRNFMGCDESEKRGCWE